MKICMIGLGSIGRKHLGNITTVLKERGIVYEIDALRSSHTALREKECNGISKQYYNIDEMPDDYDVIFITNPTSMHYDTIRKTSLYLIRRCIMQGNCLSKKMEYIMWHVRCAIKAL